MEDDSKENHTDTAPTGKFGFANASLAKMLNPNSGKYNLCHVVDEDKGIVQLLVKVKNRNRRVASRFGDYKTYPVKINLYFNQEHGMGVTPPKLSGGDTCQLISIRIGRGLSQINYLISPKITNRMGLR